MINMPLLNPVRQGATYITAFGGYDHNTVINEASFYDMHNMTSDEYPLAAAREKRKYPALDLGENTEILGTAGKENLFIIYKKTELSTAKVRIREFNPLAAPGEIYETHDTEVCDYVATGHRQIIEMGANILIFPEKYMVNTLEYTALAFTDIKPLELSVAYTGTISFKDFNGNALTVKSAGNIPPEIKNETDTETNEASSVVNIKTVHKAAKYSNGTAVGANDIWIDTSGTDPVCKKYSQQAGMWATVQPYLCLTIQDNPLEEGDAVEIEGINAISAIKVKDNQKYFVVTKKKNNEIYLPVTINAAAGGLSYNLTFKRTLPKMDFVTESQNRLWGCRYGDDGSGETVNEIFASKLGDPCNFHFFANTSIDSYYVSLGSDGAFTGAFTYQNNPVFAKRDCLHRVYGNYPSNYQVANLQCYGIKQGCENSAYVLNDIAYYYSPVGMVAYSGQLPTSIARPFGGQVFKDVVSGGTGNKLYCSMTDEDNNKHLFVFDDSKAVWHREDNLNIKCFSEINHELIATDSNDNLVSLGGIYGQTSEGAVQWSFTTGDIGYTTPNHKRIVRMILRCKTEISTRARAEIQYDNDGNWHNVGEIRPNGRMKSYSLPIIPHRCDHFMIRISGSGKFELLSIAKFTAEGSEYD